MENYDQAGRQQLLDKLRSRDRDQVSQAIKELGESGLKHTDFLSGTDLRGIRVRGGDLTGAVIEEADLSGASFSNAILAGAFLSSSNLVQVHLQDVNLNDALLDQVNLQDARLRQVILREANLNNANLRGSTLTDSVAVETSLVGAVLQGANLRGTDFTGADLSDADLSHTNLEDVRFVKTKLYRANLSHARCLDTVFAHVDLSTTIGLETVQHLGTSSVGVDTLYRSGGRISEEFLLASGWSRAFWTVLKQFAPPQEQVLPVIISYSEADQSLVKPLYDALRDQDIACWLCPHSDDTTVLESRRWHNALFCCSTASLTRPWFGHEIEAMLKRNKRAIVLVDLDGFLKTGGWEAVTDTSIRQLSTIDFQAEAQLHDKLASTASQIRTAFLKEQAKHHLDKE